MKKIIVLLSVLMFVGGCATEGKYKEKLNTWLGSDPLSLIRSWGSPNQTYETNGHQFLVYSRHVTATIPGTNPSYTTTLIGNQAYTNSYGGSPAYEMHASCITTFEVYNNRIVNWQYRGNDCVSY